MAAPDEVKQTVGKALGRIPSGVFILSASHERRADATLVSWVQQASFDPPMMTIAVAKDRAIVEIIRQGKLAALSVIAKNDTGLMKHFARGSRSNQPPFAGVETFATPGGAVAMKQALAWMECWLIEAIESDADHVLLLMQVSAGGVLREGESFTHLRGSGFHY